MTELLQAIYEGKLEHFISEFYRLKGGLVPHLLVELNNNEVI